MNKQYTAPELEMIRLMLNDVILYSPTVPEDSISKEEETFFDPLLEANDGINTP